MKILFIGSVKFSFFMLEELIKMKTNIVGVCTLNKSNFNADHYDLAKLSRANQIDFIYAPEINKSENINWIKNKSPDIIFCFGWSKLLGKEILKIPEKGVIGFHPTLLPRNRGRHPLIWPLVLGLKETGSSFFYMEESADTGNIISQKKMMNLDNDNASTLYMKIVETAKKQLHEFIPELESDNIIEKVQDNSKSNYWRKRNFNDGKIDWRMAAISIHNLVRALTKPYVGAHFENKGKIYKVWKTELSNLESIYSEPGKVLSIEKGDIIIKCGMGAIKLKEFEEFSDIKEGEYL